MKYGPRPRPLDPPNRWRSDAVRGAIAGGITASFPGTVLSTLAATASSHPDHVWLPVVLGIIIVVLGSIVGGWLGWTYGIKARAAWMCGRYPRGRCRQCRYELQGSTGGRCPECGAVLRASQLRYREKAIDSPTSSGG